MAEYIKRLTTDHPHNNLETMLNYAYAKDGAVILRYGEGEYDVDLCEYIAKQAQGYHCKVTPEQVRDGACMECDCICSILFCVATQAAELRARLKHYEDLKEQGNLAEVRRGELRCEINSDRFGDVELAKERGWYRKFFYCPNCDQLIRTESWDDHRMFGSGTVLKNHEMPNYCPYCGTKMDGKGENE